MRVLIIRPSALGDTLLLMPAIAQLSPSTEIVLVGRSPGLDILRPHVHRSMDYEGPGWHRLFLENPGKGPAFSLRNVDHVVGFLTAPDGNLSKNLESYLPQASVHFFPAFPPKGARVHVAFYLAQCLRTAGLPIDPEKSLEEACKRPLLRAAIPTGQGRKMVFHPGSGGKGKNHPPDFWLELIGKLTSHLPAPPSTESGPSPAFIKGPFPSPFSKSESLPPFFKALRLVAYASERGQGGFLDERPKSMILLGPAEEEILSFFTQELQREETEILFTPELEQLRSILIQAPIYIGHDSGITHLAAMLGTPTIALFRNSSVHQWRPLGPAVRVIEGRESSGDLIKKILEGARELMEKFR